MADPIIKKIVLKNGTIRYRFVIDIGLDADGRRRQLTVTKDTRKEAVAELSRIRHQRSNGSYVAPNKVTVDELLDMWIKTATRDVEEGTESNYTEAVRPVRRHMGHRRIQELTEDDIEAFLDWMATSGRLRGGKAGTGLSLRSVRLTLGRFRAALHLAVRRGLVTRNVAEHVTISRESKNIAAQLKAPRRPWDEAEVKQFIEGIRPHRLYGPMMLTLIAERPAEVCGARWEEDVDLDAETVAIGNTRTLVYDRSRDKGERLKVVEKKPKSESGDRVLPLPKPVTVALKMSKVQQAKEKLAAGDGYSASGYVLVDELGEPFKTDKLRRQAYKLMELAGVRKVRLYDARHAVLSWMANNGVPDTVVSAWAGHSDLSFTKRTYVHPEAKSLMAGSEKLAELLG